ncbi:hypothetical protein AAW14_09705 [Streptomyces hygroscopicus]|nr:hypothetical protein [Streptomyces hygroscopicus]
MAIEEWPSISWMSFRSAPAAWARVAAHVTEVVEPDRWEADLLVQLDEAACDVGGVEHFAVLLGEDATGLHPGGAPLRPRSLVDPAWPALDTVLDYPMVQSGRADDRIKTMFSLLRPHLKNATARDLHDRARTVAPPSLVL